MRRAALILTLIAGACFAAAPATAAGPTPQSSPTVSLPRTAVNDVNGHIVPTLDPTAVPPGLSINPAQAVAVAKTSPEMQAIHRLHHPLQYQVYMLIGVRYEVYFSFHGKFIADVLVGPRGQLGPTYTGVKIFGLYARGGYGGIFDSPWVLVPFGVMFLVPLVGLRRRSWLDVLDLAAVLSFGVSYTLFENGHFELAVWLVYPPLLYLLTRMLRRGWRPRPGGRGPVVTWPTAVLVGGLALLVAGRMLVTLLPAAEVSDVGEASVIGAYRLVHGLPLYFPSVGHPDTYGPLMYLAYVPFQLLFPGDQWTYVASARATTIAFDLLTIGALIVMGTRLRPGLEGRRLGLLMAWLWAACPATLLAMTKSTNDGLVAFLVVVAMITLSTPVRRGVTLGIATAAKIFPAILLPLLVVGLGREDTRSMRKLLAGFVVVTGASVAIFLPPGGLQEMWQHTLGYQLTRPDIFSPWALHPSLAPIKDAIQLGVIGLAGLVAFRPRGPRTPAQVSALAAALVIAAQVPGLHWFYFYIVWFFPLTLIAVLGAGAEAPPTPAGQNRVDTHATPDPIEPPVAASLVGAA